MSATKTDSVDVLIVGGGPAGSACAGQLIRAGLDVLILDKAHFPRDKVCAGWITPAVADSLELDLADYAAGRVLQPIDGFRTSVIGGRQVRTDYGRTVSYGIRRCEFDAYLLNQSGARTRLGESLAKIERSGESWIVNGSIRARFVVGAGGHFCPVSRFLGNSFDASEPVIVAQEIEFEMTLEQVRECRVSPEIPELFFCPDLKGYGWCFRKQNVLNIGLGRENESELSAHVHSFAQSLADEGKVPADAPARFKGHAYRLYGKVAQKISGDGILLIGDSAGLAYPQSGEGIRAAIESGLIAAQLIENTNSENISELGNRYQRQLSARFGETGVQLISDLIPTALKSFLGRRLLASRWFARHVVLDRWFLHVHQAAL